MGAATTIVNAKVFDGTTSQDWTSVRFADGLITKCSAASAAQEGDVVIDAGGGTVLPGLIDAHVHLVPGALAQSLTFGRRLGETPPVGTKWSLVPVPHPGWGVSVDRLGDVRALCPHAHWPGT